MCVSRKLAFSYSRWFWFGFDCLGVVWLVLLWGGVVGFCLGCLAALVGCGWGFCFALFWFWVLFCSKSLASAKLFCVLRFFLFPYKYMELQIATIEFELHGIYGGLDPCLLVLKMYSIRQLKCRDTDKPYGRELSRVFEQCSFL